MTARFSRAAIFAAALAAVACIQAPAFADDVEQVEKAEKLTDDAVQWIGYGCYDKANELLAQAEKELQGVDDTGKAPPLAKIKEARDGIAAGQTNFKADQYEQQILREIGTVEGDGSRGLASYQLHVDRVNAMLADSWTKGHLGAPKCDELAKKLAWTLKSLESKGNRADLKRLKDWLERLFEDAKATIPGPNSRGGFNTFEQQAAKIEEVLAKDENKQLLGAEVAKYKKDLADLTAENAKATANVAFADVEKKVANLQDMLDGKVEVRYWTDFENSLKYADEALAKCPQDDPRAKTLKAKLAEQRKAYEAKHAAGDRDEAVGPVVKYWASCQDYGKEDAGWESESAVTSLHDFLHNSPAKLGCEKTLHYLNQVVQRWLEADNVKKALKDYPNDAELKKTEAEAKAALNKGATKVAEFVNKLIDEGEKLPAGSEREEFQQHVYNLKQEIHNAIRGSAQCDALVARIDALDKRFGQEKEAATAAKEGLTKSLEKSVNDAWPAMLAAFKVKKLDAPDALANPGSWKGTYIHFSGGSRGVNLNRSGWDYDNQYYFIVEKDGIPICGNLDGGLEEAIKKVEKTTGVELANDEEVVGVIDGTCKVYTLFHYDNGNKSMRDRLCDGIRMRIVALKGVTVAAAVGEGTNLKACPEFKNKEFSVSESGSSSTTGGRHAGGNGFSFIHFIHRFLAWGMCLLLAVAGLLAAIHGATKFVPQIQEQKTKLGEKADYLGYAGCALAGLGVLWFGAAFVLPLIFDDVRFGSMPSIALILAGAFLAVDLARVKGKIDPEMAAKIQPVGIVLGLMCLASVPVHFFFWDWRLL